ncbi:unnamed protein product [Notodromas monacha]|nr:unnamed protein product [Notodromas monacha]CAG0921000.1 unnamed protein product [Notodromas monacha]
MRSMDQKIKKMAQKIDSESEVVLRKKLGGQTALKEILKIQRMYEKLHKQQEEKVQLAVQNYELADKHIRHLDADLSRFDCRDSDKDKKPSAATSKKSSSSSKSKKKRRADSSSDERPSKTAGSPEPPEPGLIPGIELAKTAGEVFDMPVDPNEPTYCLCQQVSYGDMIGCDNQDCPIEWFHFPCVGLKAKPKGNWYCPKCSEERKRKK